MINLDEFYLTIDKYITFQKMNTGFKYLDKKLNNILPGLYSLGADTGLGKSTFCLQIADYIASTGRKVLFYSLEMSKFEIYCKSLSRIAYQDFGEKISTKEIMFNTCNDITSQCLDKYNKYIGNIEIIEGDFTLDVNSIKKSILEYTKDLKEKPIIFIDYLQVIQPNDFKMTDKAAMDYNIKELKKLSRENFLPIFVISSLNRQGYNKDLDNTAFKESGSIEYTSDVVLGLQGKIVDELKEFDGNSKKDKEERNRIWNTYKSDSKETGIIKIKLKCLKNRFGKKDWDVEFDFLPGSNFFKEKKNTDYSFLFDSKGDG